MSTGHHSIRRALPGFGMFVSIDLEPHEIRAIRALDGDVREGLSAALDDCPTALDETDREYVLDAMESFVRSTVEQVTPPEGQMAESSTVNDYPSEAVADPDTGIVYFPDDDAPNPHATAESDGFDSRLERMQADGKISPQDADEVRRFGDFLTALAEAGVRPAERGETLSPEAAAKARAIYLDHYPEYSTPPEGQGDG